MEYVAMLAFVAAVVGIFKPYIPNVKRWHFGVAAFASFMSIGIFAPVQISPEPPTTKWLEGSWVPISGSCESGEPFRFGPNARWATEGAEGVWQLNGNIINITREIEYDGEESVPVKNGLFTITITNFDDNKFSTNDKDLSLNKWKRCTFANGSFAPEEDPPATTSAETEKAQVAVAPAPVAPPKARQTINIDDESGTLISRNGAIAKVSVIQKESKYNTVTRKWDDVFATRLYSFDCSRDFIKQEGVDNAFVESWQYHQSAIIVELIDKFCH
jgi:hypothetical protein